MSVSAIGDVVHYQRLVSLGSITNDGAQIWSPLIEGSDGSLYGTTALGGSNGYGTVFKLNKDGSGYSHLRHFGSVIADGQKSYGGLIEAGDGFLYGTTSGGGTGGAGTIFKMYLDGSGYSIIHIFTNIDGSVPEAALTEGSDGDLYGTTALGGGDDSGILFAIKKDGGNYRILHRFGPPTSTDGLQPVASLLEGSDGLLYGTTLTGGGNAVGSIFKVNKNGSGYAKLYAFSFSEAAINPSAALIEGSDNALYGTAFGGAGSVFKLNKNGTGYQVLRTFSGNSPFGALVKGRDGALYGTTYRGGGRFPIPGGGAGTVFRLNEDGSGYQVLYSFGNTVGDGTGPHAGLLLTSDGVFYGTTLAGGDSNKGTVFRLLINRVPVVRCRDLILFSDGNCTANGSIENGSFDPDDDPITLVQSPPGPYPLGTNQVTLTVTDSNGDSNTCTAFVIVLDATPPLIACPSNVVVEFNNDAGAVVEYSIPTTDACDPAPGVSSIPPSGTLFPIGTTDVQCMASDLNGNTSSCAFTITVLGARGVLENVLAELIYLRATVTESEDGRKLDEAIEHLTKSLDSEFWEDETHLVSKLGERVFRENSETVKNLCELIKSSGGDISGAVLQGFIGRILRADRLLASVAIQDAINTGVSTKKVGQAQHHLAMGDASLADDKCGNGIEDYRIAWKRAVLPQISLTPQPADGRPQLEILGQPGERFTIEASANLTDWVILDARTANAEGVVMFEDAAAVWYPVRYYRAVSY